jgi:broad specificity phosphatase PhoE
MGKLFYLRHGQTPFNLRNKEWHDAGDPLSEMDFQFSMEFVDPPLTKVGEGQILEHKASLLSLSIEKVFVSPMLRTLQTCDLLFKDVENAPKATVLPLVTEWIHVNHDAPAWPNDYPRIFPSFDWSIMPGDYFIKSLLQNKYTEGLDPNNYLSSLLTTMKNIFPSVVESREELYNRTRAFKVFIREEIQDKNVLIVGHSAFFRHLTSTRTPDGQFVGQRLLGNGEWTEVDVSGP